MMAATGSSRHERNDGRTLTPVPDEISTRSGAERMLTVVSRLREFGILVALAPWWSSSAC